MATTLEVNISASGKSIVAHVEVGETLSECADIFGEAICLNLLLRAITLQAQARGRALLTPRVNKAGITVSQGLSEDDVYARMANWKPSVGPARVGSIERIAREYAVMSAEEQEALLAKLGLKISKK